MNIIQIEDLVHVYSNGKIETVALNGISLSVKEGEKVVIIGKSGSGKSTLLKIIAGNLKPTGGLVRVAGHNVRKMSIDESLKYKRKVIGIVFQSDNLIKYLTVRENVELPLKFSKMKKEDRTKRIELLLERLEISRYIDSYPEELSGGQQQRVAIAVALANKPAILLADEPTGNLDVDTAETVYNFLVEMADTFRTTLVIVSHDVGIKNYVDRVIDLNRLKKEKHHL